MLLGISSFAYGWRAGAQGHVPSHPLLEYDLLTIVKRHGLKCVQLGDNLPVHKFDPERKENLRRHILDEGIRLELGARGLTAEHLSEYIELGRYFQSPLLRFVIDEGSYEPDLPSVADIIKDFIPTLMRDGLTLGIENHDRFKARDLARMIETLSSPHVGICLDCVNSLGAGEGLEHVAKHLCPYTVNLHVKDFSIQRAVHAMGFTVTGAPAGKGMADFPALLEVLSQFHRCESALLEQWVPFQGDFPATIELEKNWAEESLQYLKAIPLFGFGTKTVQSV